METPSALLSSGGMGYSSTITTPAVQVLYFVTLCVFKKNAIAS